MDNNYQNPTPTNEQHEQPVYNQPQQPVYQQPVYNSQPVTVASNADVKAMVFSIIGLACSCSFYLSLLGIIFSAIGMSQSKKCIAGGLITVKTKLGKIFGTIGLVLGILCLVGLVIVIIVAIASVAIGAATNSPYYYYY